MLCGTRKRSYGKVDQSIEIQPCQPETASCEESSRDLFSSTALGLRQPDTAMAEDLDNANIRSRLQDLPSEILDLILSDLSMQDLIRASHVCRTLRDAIHNSPPLLERLFLKAAEPSHRAASLNPLVLEHRPLPLDDLRCVASTWSLYDVVGTRLEDQLLCNPPATKIFMEIEVYGRLSDETHYLNVERKEGIRVLDLVVALKSRDIAKSICIWPFITIEAPSDVEFPASYQTGLQRAALENRECFVKLSEEVEYLKQLVGELQGQIKRDARKEHCARCVDCA